MDHEEGAGEEVDIAGVILDDTNHNHPTDPPGHSVSQSPSTVSFITSSSSTDLIKQPSAEENSVSTPVPNMYSDRTPPSSDQVDNGESNGMSVLEMDEGDKAKDNVKPSVFSSKKNVAVLALGVARVVIVILIVIIIAASASQSTSANTAGGNDVESTTNVATTSPSTYSAIGVSSTALTETQTSIANIEHSPLITATLTQTTTVFPAKTTVVSTVSPTTTLATTQAPLPTKSTNQITVVTTKTTTATEKSTTVATVPQKTTVVTTVPQTTTVITTLFPTTTVVKTKPPTTTVVKTEPPTTTVVKTEPPTTAVATTEPPDVTVAATEPLTTIVVITEPPTTTEDATTEVYTTIETTELPYIDTAAWFELAVADTGAIYSIFSDQNVSLIIDTPTQNAISIAIDQGNQVIYWTYSTSCCGYGLMSQSFGGDSQPSANMTGISSPVLGLDTSRGFVYFVGVAFAGTSQFESVFSYDISTRNTSAIPPIFRGQHACCFITGITVHTVTGAVYYADNFTRTVNKCYQGSCKSLIGASVERTIRDITFDGVDLLYWCDHHTIVVYNLTTGQLPRLLTTDTHVEIRAIQSIGSYVYVTDGVTKGLKRYRKTNGASEVFASQVTGVDPRGLAVVNVTLQQEPLNT